LKISSTWKRAEERTVLRMGPVFFLSSAYLSWVPRKLELSGENSNLFIAIPTRLFDMVAAAP